MKHEHIKAILEGVIPEVKASINAAQKPLLERISALEQRSPEKGDKGDKGDKGETGERGIDGAPGRDGIDGKDGAPGERGLDGKDGAPGIDGAAGRDGIDGKDGLPGLKGDPGENGAAGLNGKDGRDGIDGKDGKDAITPRDGIDGKDANLVLVSADIAEEVAKAVQFLSEAPPVIFQKHGVEFQPRPTPPRPIGIERDGQGGYRVIYDEARQ
jgi:hypothetical protein